MGRLDEVFASEEGDDGVEGNGPVEMGGLGVGAEGFDVERDAEAFLGWGEVEEGGADDALELGVVVVERGGAANEAV